MPVQKFHVKGAAKLEATLKKAGTELGEMKDLHARAGALLAETARPLAPVLTGRLAASIRSSGTKTAGVMRAGGGSVPYAGVQEFGWPARNIPAQPYGTAALIETEPAVLDLYQKEVEKVLSKVKGA